MLRKGERIGKKLGRDAEGSGTGGTGGRVEREGMRNGGERIREGMERGCRRNMKRTGKGDVAGGGGK